MSIHKSYFSRNNTIQTNSYLNTSSSPYTELYFGDQPRGEDENSFTRFIFDLNLSPLFEKIDNKEITFNCSDDLKHTLRMKNTSFFDKNLSNGLWSNTRRRATSFDLFLYRIPLTLGIEGEIQEWDEGVGYDYVEDKTVFGIDKEKTVSDRPSNWFNRQTRKSWSHPGIYSNKNNSAIEGLNYSELEIIDIQHFEKGNEDIEFDMSIEINKIIRGEIERPSGWGISFLPDFENITGMTESYSVGFYTRNTQTFYEPYLDTKHYNLVDDDRLTFYEKKVNKLYLYSNVFGESVSLDKNPKVDLYDMNGELIEGYTDIDSCEIHKGVYEITINDLSYDNLPCMVYDVWKEISYGGNVIEDVENSFVLNPINEFLKINSKTNNNEYSFSVSGIRNDEKIINTDVRRLDVVIKKSYTSKEIINKINVEYRVYVKEGQTEVDVVEWSGLNRGSDGYYINFDTRDKIPNEYHIDFRIKSNHSVNTHKKQIKFQIVNRK